jgi:Domain of unknown function (DUF4926)
MTSVLEEFDTVVLTHDLPSVQLRTGDIGAVVHRYVPGGYEVEFVTGGGDTVAVLTLSDADVRPLAAGEILHARPLGQ